MRRFAVAAVAFAMTLGTAVPGAAQETHLAAAVRLAGEGRFTEALAEAHLASTQPEAAQAALYVWHHAGALEEALEAGLEGLAVVPEDPWLLDRCAFVAISLGDGALALEVCSRLERILGAEAFRQAAWMREEAERLTAQAEAEKQGEARARWTVLAALLLSTALSGWLIRPRCAPDNESARMES